MDQNNEFYGIEADFFNALASPSRLEILDLLRDGEACVCHIQAMLDQRQAYISQHLNVLRQAGLVTSRKDGLRVYYRIFDPKLYEMMDQVKEILQSWGNWKPTSAEEAKTSLQKRVCNCPQCTSETEAHSSQAAQVEYV